MTSSSWSLVIPACRCSCISSFYRIAGSVRSYIGWRVKITSWFMYILEDMTSWWCFYFLQCVSFKAVTFDILLPNRQWNIFSHFVNFLTFFLYLSLLFFFLGWRWKEKKTFNLVLCKICKRGFHVYIFGLQSCFFHFIFHIRHTQTSWLHVYVIYAWCDTTQRWQSRLLTGQTGTAKSNKGCSPLIYCTVCQILPWFY